jgi:hypothetical protein
MNTIVFSFIFLGFFESVIKPTATYFVKRKIVYWTPLVLSYVDDLLPSVFNFKDSVDLDKLVRDKFSELTGEDWSKVNIDYFWRIYDPRVTLSKLNSSVD